MPTLLGRNYQLQELQTLWGPLYAATLNLLGSTGTIFPIGDPNHGQPNATTFTTIGEEQVTCTWSEAPNTFDTPMDLGDPTKFQGIIPVLTFNGTDEEADTPDIGYFTRALAAMSVGAWVNLTDATSSSILSKYAASGDQREWRFHLTSGDDLQLILTDEDDGSSPNATLDSLTDTAISQGIWVYLVATYDGSANASGIDLYVDGAVVASTDTDDANFTSMRDKTAVVELGDAENANFFDGKMACGPLAPFYTQAALSADAVKRLYNLGAGALGLI